MTTVRRGYLATSTTCRTEIAKETSSSSKEADDPTLDQEERKERKRWSKAEDLVLISSWLNTSKDSVVSNEQRSKAFWNRIGALYNASPSILADEKREPNHCKQRWRKVNDQVSRFCGS